MTCPQEAVDTVDNYVSTEVLHQWFKRVICGGLVQGWRGHGIGALVASGVRTVLFV
jgi:hypothetical protein